jgi:glycosyltransferase involved in cell wall biosynthesis
VFIQKVMPPSWLLSFLRHLTPRLVLDLDDAVYLGYPGSSPGRAAQTAKRVAAGVPFFDAILTSNELIRSDLGLANDSRCIVFPGPSPQILEDTFEPAREKLVLWLGSPSTEPNVEVLLPGLSQGLPEQDFLIVGSKSDAANDRVSRKRWTYDIEADALRRSWAGLMPLEQSDWNSRKAGYKILEYLRGGVIPVVQDSPIVRTLMGTDAERLCELVSGDSPDAWVDAVARSLCRTRDEGWFDARESVFSAWSNSTFARLILGVEGSEGNL